MKLKKLFLIIFAMLPCVTGCARVELASHFGKKMMGSEVQSKGKYKVGSPYTIKGKTYYPAVDYGYDEKGIASWYGPGFHGKSTANGERYDQNELTAAHRTLPLPSIVRVTNLENGKSLIVRVNDRGPFAHGRIIDMSARSAELLGFKNKGIAKVRVQLLEAESKKVAEIAKAGGDTRGIEVPMNHAGYNTTKMPDAHLPARPKLASLKTPAAQTIPGHVRQGNFYPDPVLSEYPVTEENIYIQTGAFSSRETAMKYATSLDRYGRAQIYPANIDGRNIYRVRFPAQTIETADTLLARLIDDGYTQAIIVID